MIEIAVDADEDTVRALGLENRLCTACWKSWMYVEQRKQFLLARSRARQRSA